jgi:hypothetical protein
LMTRWTNAEGNDLGDQVEPSQYILNTSINLA